MSLAENIIGRIRAGMKAKKLQKDSDVAGLDLDGQHDAYSKSRGKAAERMGKIAKGKKAFKEDAIQEGGMKAIDTDKKETERLARRTHAIKSIKSNHDAQMTKYEPTGKPLSPDAAKYGNHEGSSPEKETARRLNKEEIGLQELSRKTLGSYIKKAHVSGLDAAAQQEYHYQRKNRKPGSNRHHDLGMATSGKTGEKREQGINRAVEKLTREENDMIRSERQIVEILASANPQHQLKDVVFAALSQRAVGKLDEIKHGIAANYFGQGEPLDEGARSGFKDQDLKNTEKVEKHIARGKTQYEKPYGKPKKFKKVSSDKYNPLQYEYND